MKFFHKSNFINLFKTQVNTLLNWKLHHNLHHFWSIWFCWDLRCSVIWLLCLSVFIWAVLLPVIAGFIYLFLLIAVWDCQTTWAFITRLLLQYCSQKAFACESLRDGLIHDACHLYKGGGNKQWILLLWNCSVELLGVNQRPTTINLPFPASRLKPDSCGLQGTAQDLAA